MFLPTKKAAHRMRIIFGLLDLKATELHGALTQLQVLAGKLMWNTGTFKFSSLFKRIESLKAFAEGSVDFMLATDLASRGLDIERVKTVSSPHCIVSWVQMFSGCVQSRQISI